MLIFCIKKCVRNNKGVPKKKISFRCFANYDKDEMLQSLAAFNWGRYYGTCDIDMAWKIMFDQIELHADFYAPEVTRLVKDVQSPWFTKELLCDSIERDRLLASAKRSKDPETFVKARQKRNAVKTAVTNARSNYYIDLLTKSKGNPKKFWSNLTRMTNITSNHGISNVKDPITNVLADAQRSADIINDYFVNVGEALDHDLPSFPDPVTSFRVDTNFQCVPNISTTLVEELIDEIDIYKPSGCIKIPMKIYKDAFEGLLEQLAYIFNLSLSTGVIPLA